MKFAVLSIITGLTLLVAHSAAAVTYEPADLASVAEDHVTDLLYTESDDRIRVTAGTLDPRMGNRNCEQPLHVALANNSSLERQATVMISCPDQDNWRLFIPVRIEQLRSVLVTTRPLAPGDIIGSGDIRLSQIDIHQTRDALITDPEELIGAQVRRRVGANQPLQARHTCFVCRGQDVTIISGSNGLEIRATGVARSDGLLGERITIRNTRSNKDIQAVVSGSNEVRVGL